MKTSRIVLCCTMFITTSLIAIGERIEIAQEANPTPTPFPTQTQLQAKQLLGNPGDWLKRAEAGDAYCQAIAGYKFRVGDGVAIDWLKALKFSADASAQGNAIGTYNLGRLFEDGRGVEKDEKGALALFLKAVPKLEKMANSGDPYAQTAFGDCLYFGKGINPQETRPDIRDGTNWGISPRDEAERWYRRAAQQGNACGQACLGFYLDGEEAVKWYRKAAEQGNADGQFYLGRCLIRGRGVEKNDREAVQWFKKAAEQGKAEGQCFLAMCLEGGDGIEKNEQEAFQWYRKAAAQGDQHAANKVEDERRHIEAAKQAAVRKLKEQKMPDNLRTSLQGGPDPDTIIKFLGLVIRNDSSANQFPSRTMDRAYQAGVIGNSLTDAKIANEYTRKIDGETVYFYDFNVELNNPYGPVKRDISCSFVARGKMWYIFSVNGRRVGD